MTRRCECHGEPMLWHKDASRRGGGRWRCAVRKREMNRANATTENGRASARSRQARYLRTDKGRVARRRAHLRAATRRREALIRRIKELT
jgi:hypothetical protein